MSHTLGVGRGTPHYSQTLIRKTPKTPPNKTLCDFKSLEGSFNFYCRLKFTILIFQIILI